MPRRIRYVTHKQGKNMIWRIPFTLSWTSVMAHTLMNATTRTSFEKQCQNWWLCDIFRFSLLEKMSIILYEGPILGVKIRNLKVNSKTGGTWRQVRQWTMIMNIYDFFYSTYLLSLKTPAYKQKSSIFAIFFIRRHFETKRLR